MRRSAPAGVNSRSANTFAAVFFVPLFFSGVKGHAPSFPALDASFAQQHGADNRPDAKLVQSKGQVCLRPVKYHEKTENEGRVGFYFSENSTRAV